jgi:hypothetical protein
LERDMQLQQFVRFFDLKEAGIVDNRAQLRNLQQKHGFPLGILAGESTRIFPVEEVNAWLTNRPTEISAVASQRVQRLREAKEAKRSRSPRKVQPAPEQVPA